MRSCILSKEADKPGNQTNRPKGVSPYAYLCDGKVDGSRLGERHETVPLSLAGLVPVDLGPLHRPVLGEHQLLRFFVAVGVKNAQQMRSQRADM